MLKAKAHCVLHTRGCKEKGDAVAAAAAAATAAALCLIMKEDVFTYPLSISKTLPCIIHCFTVKNVLLKGTSNGQKQSQLEMKSCYTIEIMPHILSVVVVVVRSIFLATVGCGGQGSGQIRAG